MEVTMKLSCNKRATVRQYPPRNSTKGSSSNTTSKKRKAGDAGLSSSNHGPSKRSSSFRGVTRHRWTGRFEAHLWDKSSWNDKQRKKGRQVYLGAYDDEASAAQAYDLAALKYWGPGTVINFKLDDYEQQLAEMENISREEYLATLRRKSSGFSRGVSKYRGVARHHHNGRWEARIGRVDGNKYLYLGTFGTQEEAARAYDMAAIEYRGAAAVTNFDVTSYSEDLQRQSKQANATLRYTQDGGSSNDLQELGRVANFGGGGSTTTTTTKTFKQKCESRESEAGFVAEEFSSGSSDVTSLTTTDAKEEEYVWSQYTNFEIPLPEYSSRLECESQRLENDTASYSFWNGFMNESHVIDQDSFLTNVLHEEELPTNVLVLPSISS